MFKIKQVLSLTVLSMLLLSTTALAYERAPTAPAPTQVAPAQDHNSSRSNKTSPATCNDGTDCPEDQAAVKELDKSSPKLAETCLSSEDCDDASGANDTRAEGADYNSSRSNKSRTAQPNICDGVTCPDGSCAATADLCQEIASGTRYMKFEGVDGNMEDSKRTANDSSDPSEVTSYIEIGSIKGEVTEDNETGKRQLSSIALAAQELRNWNPEDRAAFEAFKATVAENTPEHATVRLTEEVLNNDNIETLSLDYGKIEITYKSQLKLFGLFKLNKTVTASSTLEGDTEIKYPWYRFLSTKPSSFDIKATLERLRNAL